MGPWAQEALGFEVQERNSARHDKQYGLRENSNPSDLVNHRLSLNAASVNSA
jgi:hypothetical protein